MKISKFKRPYITDQNGKKAAAFRNINGKSGVYIIKENGKIVYVGYSASNLYKTMYRHFQQWNDRQQQRKVYTNPAIVTVRVVLTPPSKADKLEKALIIKYKPRDNKEKLEAHKATPALKRVENEYFKLEVTDMPF
jgi:predicted GIY-YIG superfamily endonuclease